MITKKLLELHLIFEKKKNFEKKGLAISRDEVLIYYERH